MLSLIYLNSIGMDETVNYCKPRAEKKTLTLPHFTDTRWFEKEQQNKVVVKYMVTLFEENIKTVACTTWNECKLKSGVQTPAAEVVQGEFTETEDRKVKAQPHSSKHPSILVRDGRPGKESH